MSLLLEIHIGIIFPISSLLRRKILKNEKAEKFWSFVSLKNDVFGINTLRGKWKMGNLKTETLDKANICKRHFQSAFTRDSDNEIPSKGKKNLHSHG